MILRSSLLFLSRRRRLRRWVETSPIARRLTGRFIAGLTLDQGLAVCARLNAEGISATLDHLGESVTSLEEGRASSEAYLEALQRIAGLGLQSTVSIKLTQFGLGISEQACRDNVARVVQAAARTGNHVEVDMESFEHVEPTLQLVLDMHAQFGCVRAVIQAYLRRSEADVDMLCDRGIPVRLCKGAYQEPPSVAFPARREVNANYRRLVRRLLQRGPNPAVATHDEAIIRDVIQWVRREGIPRDHLEFQMLYGIRKSLQRGLVREGFRVRLYVPYGVAWYPYFMRRLAERPANLLFLAKNILRR